MNADKQRIAIAQACGWTYDKHGHWMDATGQYGIRGLAPDFLNDLNAMHEAENKIPNDKWLEFDRHVANTNPTEYQTSWVKRMYRATAAQRAEAFLRTLNLYTP